MTANFIIRINTESKTFRTSAILKKKNYNFRKRWMPAPPSYPALHRGSDLFFSGYTYYNA